MKNYARVLHKRVYVHKRAGWTVRVVVCEQVHAHKNVYALVSAMRRERKGGAWRVRIICVQVSCGLGKRPQAFPAENWT